MNKSVYIIIFFCTLAIMIGCTERPDAIFDNPYDPTGIAFVDMQVVGVISASEGTYEDKIVVSWTNNGNAEEYYVFRSTSAGGTYDKVGTVDRAEGTHTIYTDELTIRDRYYYKVQPYHSKRVQDDLSEYADGWLSPWTEVSPMSSGRKQIASAVVDGKIYVIGGKDSSGATGLVEEYDPVSDTWITKTSMPATLYAPACTEYNDKIYVFGGANAFSISVNNVRVYDPAKDTWTNKVGMPYARDRLRVASVNDKIYAIGGEGTFTVVSSKVMEYDPTGNNWVAKSSMLKARENFGCVVFSSKIYAIGGYTGLDGIVAVEEYDPTGDVWISKTEKPNKRIFSQSEVVNNKIYTFSTYKTTYKVIVEEYDPGTDTWVTKGVVDINRKNFATAMVDDKIYLIGGAESSSTFMRNCFVYEPEFDYAQR